MKKLLGVSAVIAAATVASLANAAPIVIDDFTVGADMEVNQAVPSAYDAAAGRWLSINILKGVKPNYDPYAYVDVVDNQLRIVNGSGENSIVELKYDPIVKDFVTSITLSFATNDAGIGSPGNTVEFFIDGVLASAGAKVAAESGDPFTLTFALSVAERAALASGATLSFLFSGADDFDLTLDGVSMNVPEPAALALFGLGLVGLGVARRRRIA